MDVTNLKVYQQALTAFLLIEELAVELPYELSDVKKQILRSSKSVIAILAEGFSKRRSQREFYRYVIDAMASSDETITHLRIIAKSRFNSTSLKRLKK